MDNRHYLTIKHSSVFLIGFLAIGVFALPYHAQAEGGLVDALKEKISSRVDEIKKLETEIATYQLQVREVKEEAKTLQGEIASLTKTQKSLDTNIKKTAKKITDTTRTVVKLTHDIDIKSRDIATHESDLSVSVRLIHELDSRSLVEILLSGDTFSGFLDSIESLAHFQAGVQSSMQDLQELKNDLERQKTRLEKEKKALQSQEVILADQKVIVQDTTRTKNTILKETKNKESEYQSLLQERLAQKEALEREIAEYEEQLRVEIDPNTLPVSRPGVLGWPLEAVRITQFFGKTPFASENPQVYNGSGHNGLDLGAPVGTPLLAAAAGVVVDTGDTDKQCYRVSYGKWVLIRHYNGLSTLYAHLSLIKAVAGQEVEAGDTIGYSGNTGYSTGPHLHFTVFATEAVQVSSSYKSKVCGTNLKLPLSAKNGYLNPLSYLPTLSAAQ